MYKYLQAFCRFICCHKLVVVSETKTDTTNMHLENVSSDSVKLAKPKQIIEHDWCHV